MSLLKIKQNFSRHPSIVKELAAKPSGLEVVEKMLIVLTPFAPNGICLVLEKVVKLTLSFAGYRPTNGSSNIALPSKLHNYCVLLNTRIHEDANCFFYCYFAQYQMHINLSLDRPGRDYNRGKIFPETD